MAISKWFLVLIVSFSNSPFQVRSAEVSRDVTVADYQTISLLKICYNDRLNPLLIVGSDAKFNDRLLRDFDGVPVILISDDVRKLIPRRYVRLEMFVLRADTTGKLELLLQVLKKSNLWDIDGTFLIANQNCQNAMEFLKVAWKMNLLSSIFLCYSLDSGVKIYTYNPYTSRAPAVWQREDVPGPDDRWTLYSQLYMKDEIACEHLDFDKKKFLDGYKIHAVGITETNESWTRKKEYDVESLKTKMRFDKQNYFKAIFTALDVTPVILYDLEGYDNEAIAAALNPTSLQRNDIVLNARSIGKAPEDLADEAYPFFELDAAALTQHRGFLAPEEKIALVYNTEMLILTAITLVISFVVLALKNNRGIPSASFEILRLLIGNSFLHALKSNSMRIYFTPIFFLILILNTTFGGYLVEFLTNPRHRKDVDTLEDFRKLNFHVYVNKLLGDSIIAPDWAREYVHTSSMNCSKFVLNNNNTRTACIAPTSFLVQVAVHNHCHFFRIQLPRPFHLTFWTREDWPLMDKFNHISLQIYAGGLKIYWEDRMVHEPLKRFSLKYSAEEDPQIRKLNLNDFIFAFNFLNVGMLCSIIVFSIEILFNKVRKIMIKYRNSRSMKKNEWNFY